MLNGKISEKTALNGNIQSRIIETGTGGGTTDYTKLKNLPSINDVELVGNKTSEELGLVSSFDGSKESGNNRFTIYAQELGQQKNLPFSLNPVDFAIAQYSSGGNLKVATPRQLYDATTKKYVDERFNGANKAVSFVNYSAMISSLNALPVDSYNVGQNIMIVTLAVPDLWVSEIAETPVAYTYVSDDDFVNELNTNGSVQVGYYKLSALETQKVDLAEYVKFTDIAQSTKAGLVKSAGTRYGININPNNGNVTLSTPTEAEIDAKEMTKALTLTKIDYGVKVGLTTNTIELTDEEKAVAQSWLGVPQFTATQLEDGSYSLTIGG